jgi:hypothetical protein
VAVDGAKRAGPGRPRPAPFAGDLQLALLCGAAAALYVGLVLSAPGLPEAVKVGVPFLLLPAAAILLLGKPLDLGRLDRTFAISAASYAPFAALAAAAAPGAAWYYAPLAASAAGASPAALWAASTFVHVGAVDFFSKRVVQSEAHARFGARAGVAVSVAVWSGVHIIEWQWLRFIFGEAGAAAYLVAAGIVTAYAYLAWRNVLGLMVGHTLVNVAALAAAVSLYG